MTSRGQCPRGGACECPRVGAFFKLMTSRGQCPRGGACECPRVGAFFKLMTSRGQCPRGGGCAWSSTHPSSDPPPPPGWLATGLKVIDIPMCIVYTCYSRTSLLRTPFTTFSPIQRTHSKVPNFRNALYILPVSFTAYTVTT